MKVRKRLKSGWRKKAGDRNGSRASSAAGSKRRSELSPLISCQQKRPYGDAVGCEVELVLRDKTASGGCYVFGRCVGIDSVRVSAKRVECTGLHRAVNA